jgi:hypothetical protein
VLVESYGWQQHLTPYFRPLPQIKQYQHFFGLNAKLEVTWHHHYGEVWWWQHHAVEMVFSSRDW